MLIQGGQRYDEIFLPVKEFSPTHGNATPSLNSLCILPTWNPQHYLATRARCVWVCFGCMNDDLLSALLAACRISPTPPLCTWPLNVVTQPSSKYC